MDYCFCEKSLRPFNNIEKHPNDNNTLKNIQYNTLLCITRHTNAEEKQVRVNRGTIVKRMSKKTSP